MRHHRLVGPAPDAVRVGAERTSGHDGVVVRVGRRGKLDAGWRPHSNLGSQGPWLSGEVRPAGEGSVCDVVLREPWDAVMVPRIMLATGGIVFVFGLVVLVAGGATSAAPYLMLVIAAPLLALGRVLGRMRAPDFQERGTELLAHLQRRTGLREVSDPPPAH